MQSAADAAAKAVLFAKLRAPLRLATNSTKGDAAAMKPEDAEEYTQALAQIIAGGFRQIRLGPRLGVNKSLKLAEDEWLKKYLGDYVKQGVDQQLQTVKALKAAGVSNRKIAKAAGVSEGTIRSDLRAQSATRRGQKIQRKTKGGNGTAFSATQQAPVDVVSAVSLSAKAQEVAAREAERSARLAERSKTKAERPPQPLPDGTFRLLYADPPWRYEHVKTESRAVENQYPTMELDAICALNVPAAEDAVLFLWATSPKLVEALQVLDAWGFSYRTCAVWDKEQIGMGYYFRQQHELLLVGARGNAPVPDAGTRLPSVFRSKRSEHSEKPTFVYGYLEAMYPSFTRHDRVELFGRAERPDWTIWSNEPAVAS